MQAVSRMPGRATGRWGGFTLIELLVVIAINDAPCTGCVTSPDDPNWGGPHLRHAGRSNVAFADSHVEPLKASRWYWSGTPWLKPDVAER